MLAALLLAGAPAQGFDPRYELGWRMKAFERAWLAETRLEERRRVLPQWQAAVTAFFAGESDAAARAMDEGRAALAPGEASAMDALAVVPEARLFEAATAEIGFELFEVYPGAPLPFELVAGSFRARVERLPWRARLPCAPLPAGETSLALLFVAGERELGRRALHVSAAAELEERMDRLAAGLAGLPPSAPTVEGVTARALHALLEELAWEGRGETDLPAHELLVQAEECLQAARAGRRWPKRDEPGERRLWFPAGAAAVPARVLVPAAAPGAPRPLVVALHGAGGSENLFFEGYGAGAIVAACRARGWWLVAPRHSPLDPLDLPALVRALVRELPADPTQVVLVGHSLGAMRACGAQNESPGSFRALGLLGGAGGVRDPAAWRDLPVFLAAGEHDFARAGVEELARRLRASGARRTALCIPPATEHLTIVGAAVPELFAFLDGLE